MDTKNLAEPFSHIRLSCNVLKIIACISMLIDHIGYGIIHNYMISHSMDIAPDTFSTLNSVYEICRGVGRLAFPIFCFFIVEGFLHTRNVWKYALRLLIFAAVSELPFDLGLYQKNIYNDHQNIMLTFFIALFLLIVLKFLEENRAGLSMPVVYLAYICAVIAFADVAYLLGCDYSWKCMMLVSILYFTRQLRPLNLVAGAAATSWREYSPISFLLLYFYDPQIRPRFKYAFYVFYPLHLFLIYLVAKFMI